MLVRRLLQLALGLFLFGFSTALMLRAGLGLNPWDVFHQGVADRLGRSIGTVIVATGAAVLLLWIPLRERPGVGTVANMLFVGLAANWSLSVLPTALGLPMQIAFLVGGIVLQAVAAGTYIGAGLGAGPRDGLMTGLVARTGWSIRSVRGGIEVAVVAIGWLLGGTVGIGTLVYAAAIGPLVQIFLPLLTVGKRRRAASGDRLHDCAP
ncbi:MAG TPA: hypothetical protein VF680_07125 [Allosphingosinicella sp.]|jgi:uncharacterized membrane protein YczE